MPVPAISPIVNMGSTEVLVGAAIDVSGYLREGQTLSSVTSTIAVTPSNSPDATPTATGAVVSSTELTICGNLVDAQKAIQFTLDGNGAAKKTYTLTWAAVVSNGSEITGSANFRIV